MTVEEVLDRYGRDKIGMPDNSQFVMPKAQMDDLVARTGGDVGKLEQALGIPEGAWTNREMVQINIATPRDFNVRMPSGNEMGANNLWLPGGRLPTGQLEAVVDQIPKGGYTESLLPQAGKNLTPSNAPALNLAPAGHGMKPVTNPPAPATPVKAHTSANQANQGSHPVADPGASPTVKRAINALQEGSPDTRIGKTELQFREAVEGGAKGVGVANTTERSWQVSTGGLRNELPLTATQQADAIAYAKSLGVPEEAITVSENMNTSYKMLFGTERLYIGTDVLPAVGEGLRANSRIGMNGALAHEVVGHRAAEFAGKTQANLYLEEAQASIRAARFAPELTGAERVTLIRDGLERLHGQGLRIRDVRSQLWINEP